MSGIRGDIRAILSALTAAALYALNVPLSKLLLKSVPATMMAAFLYLGAGAGLFAITALTRLSGVKSNGLPLTKKQLPYTLGMIFLDVAAPILLMLGLRITTSENASLLGNFEIAATTVIALALFHERVSRRLWCAISLITLSGIILTFGGSESLEFSSGSLLILGACVCWGFENNCTRMLSSSDTSEIVVIKGICSGLGSLVIALLIGEKLPDVGHIAAAMLLGFAAYGLSIYFYILAQRTLGAAKTSAYYAVAPFIGVILSFVIFREPPAFTFYPALAVMCVGAYLSVRDTLS